MSNWVNSLFKSLLCCVLKLKSCRSNEIIVIKIWIKKEIVTKAALPKGSSFKSVRNNASDVPEKEQLRFTNRTLFSETTGPIAIV